MCKVDPDEQAAIKQNFFMDHKAQILERFPSFDLPAATGDDWDLILAKRSGICDVAAEIEQDERNAQIGNHPSSAAGKAILNDPHLSPNGSLIVNAFAAEPPQQLPMEFAVEAQKLLGISLEGSVG